MCACVCVRARARACVCVCRVVVVVVVVVLDLLCFLWCVDAKIVCSLLYNHCAVNMHIYSASKFSCTL